MIEDKKVILRELVESDNELMSALQKVGDLWIKGLRKVHNIPDDWEYKVGCTTVATWQELLNTIGEENILFISGHVRTSAENTKSDTDIMRFSIFVSPKGMDKARSLREEILERMIDD